MTYAKMYTFIASSCRFISTFERDLLENRHLRGAGRLWLSLEFKSRNGRGRTETRINEVVISSLQVSEVFRLRLQHCRRLLRPRQLSRR